MKIIIEKSPEGWVVTVPGSENISHENLRFKLIRIMKDARMVVVNEDKKSSSSQKTQK
jgi:hypothetical protein